MRTLTRPVEAERTEPAGRHPHRRPDRSPLYVLAWLASLLVLFFVGYRAFAGTAMDSEPHGSIAVPLAITVAAMTAPPLGMWLYTRERAWAVRTLAVFAIVGLLALGAAKIAG